MPDLGATNFFLVPYKFPAIVIFLDMEPVGEYCSLEDEGLFGLIVIINLRVCGPK